MRHHNSVFHQIQKHVPWGVFDRLVDEYKADYRVRKLTTKSQFLALLFGQLAGAVTAAMGLGLMTKILEGWAGAVVAKILVLVFIIIFIQKRPQGLFALKGRFVED